MTQERVRLSQVAVGCAITFGMAAIIAVLTLTPIPISGPSGSDKIYHILAFACLALPLPLTKPRWTIWVILSVVAYGGTIELLQPYFGRHAEWGDLWVDGFGAVLGAFTGSILSRCLIAKYPRCALNKRVLSR